ncbi:hypothetical protein ACF0H5_024044 [Mactra antiquata]
MLFLCMIVKILVSTTIASKVTTKFKHTYGEKLDNIIKYLAKEVSNSESVGVRISSSDKDLNEPLSYNWMENREYVSGYSYYEKILVDQEFDENQANGHIKVKIQGPLTTGSRLFISCSASKPFTRFTVYVLDQIYMNGEFPQINQRFLVDFRPGGLIVYNWRTNHAWQTETRYYTSGSNLQEVIPINIDVEYDRFYGTAVLDEFSRYVEQPAPGDIPTAMIVELHYDQPVLHRLVYERGE